MLNIVSTRERQTAIDNETFNSAQYVTIHTVLNNTVQQRNYNDEGVWAYQHLVYECVRLLRNCGNNTYHN